MENLYSSTLGIKDAERGTQTYTAQKNRSSKLAVYKKEKKRGFAPVPFPEDLFRQIREEIPKDLFVPAKSLFFHKKENIPKPQKPTPINKEALELFFEEQTDFFFEVDDTSSVISRCRCAGCE